ncbi:Phosphoethanolamine transferase EptC [Fusobacterium necrophorum subsp. funduliforme]|uniref:phosphoethanolamine transferase n=1 Tax=Fusobacterium necrophorum TaxID=859 RepID=UPI001B8CFA9E|nr:phosphoethanolamine transferase [Fusobacterium necrophorum]MBR8722496.1 Phosphoethanolamine transferase EptC [Fusobacterium necrophorum subsp. funduliforme]
MELLYEMLIQNGKILFFLLWLHMGINIFVWRIEHGKFEKRIFEKTMNSFFFLFFVNAILLFFPYVSYVYATILTILCFSEALFYFEYRSLFTSNTFLVLQETNVQESKEFLKEILSFRFFRNCFLLFLLVFLVPYFLVWGMREWNFDTFQYFWSAIFLFSCVVFLQAQLPKKRKRYYSYLPLLRILKAYSDARQQRKENELSLEEQQKIEILIEKAENKADTLIFVIGESASRNYLEIYGSYLKNTPYMCKRKEERNLFIFEDVISSESLTAISIPNMLTFKNYEKKEAWYQCPNLISILNKAGYETYWISNQSKNETVGRVFSSLSTSSFFVEDLKNNEEGYDEILIKKGLEILKDSGKKAIFFHLSGSHNSYAKRYPKSWGMDTIESIPGQQKEKIKKYIAEYSNSLRYTDYVLNSIIQKFEKENMLCFYLSDHAEEMYESRNVRGHAGDGGSRYMVEIPMFLYLSPSFQKQNPELVNICEQRKTSPYMTDDIIHTVLGILGIQTPDYEEERDFLSLKFNPNRKRMYQGKDYDSFWKIQFSKKGE